MIWINIFTAAICLTFYQNVSIRLQSVYLQK